MYYFGASGAAFGATFYKKCGQMLNYFYIHESTKMRFRTCGNP
jgi:hypothetical protein